MSEVLNIRVTVGGGTYRAHVNSSKVIATCTMGAEQAAEAVLVKWNKSVKLTTAWTLRLVDQDHGNVSTWFQFEATPAEAAPEARRPPEENTDGSETPREGGAGETASAVPPAIPQSLAVLSPEIVSSEKSVTAIPAPTVVSLPGLEFAIPETLEGVMKAIGEAEKTGQRLAKTVTIYIAHVRDTYYKDDAKGWEKAMKARFGYERRFCFSCWKVGKALVRWHRTLLPEQVVSLAETPLDSLEVIASIPEHVLPVFLKKHPEPGKMERSTARKVATCYVRNRTVAELEQEEERLAEESELKAKNKLERKKAKKSPEAKIPAALQALVSMMADSTAMNRSAQEVDPMTAIQAGFCALQLALLQLECGGTALSAAQFDVTVKLAAQFGQEFEKHKPQES